MSRNQTKIEQETQAAKGGGRILTILIFTLPWLPSRFWISIDLIFITLVFWVMMHCIRYVMYWQNVQEAIDNLRALSGRFEGVPIAEELKLFVNSVDSWIIDQTKYK